MDRIVLKRLGLKPRDEFLQERAVEWLKLAKEGYFDRYREEELDERMRFRGTGRTVEMLLKALRYVQLGHPVLIMAHTQTYAGNLRGRLREWCRILGGREDLVLMAQPSCAPLNLRTFHDHYGGVKGWLRDPHETRSGPS